MTPMYEAKPNKPTLKRNVLLLPSIPPSRPPRPGPTGEANVLLFIPRKPKLLPG